MDYSHITAQVGRRIRQLRIDNSWSQEALALSAEISPNYLGQLERGLRTPTIETLSRICRALRISLSEFFIFEDAEADDKYALALRNIEVAFKKIPANSAMRISLIIQELSLLTPEAKEE